jgi:hypothetical protein
MDTLDLSTIGTSVTAKIDMVKVAAYPDDPALANGSSLRLWACGPANFDNVLVTSP